MAIGLFAVWIGLAATIVAMAAYWNAMLRTVREPALANGVWAGLFAIVPTTAYVWWAAGRNAGIGWNIGAVAGILALTVGVYYVLRAIRGRQQAAPDTAATGNGNGDGNGHGNGHGNGVNKPGAAAADIRYEERTEKILTLGRRAFYVAGICAFVAAVVLMTLILGRHYEMAYVHQNSNNRLPSFYRFASFWSQQEGTFVLWACYGTVLGLLFLRKARSEERWVMPFFLFVQIFLFVLMTAMSPFALIPLTDEAGKPTEMVEVMKRENIAIPSGWWQNVVYHLGFWSKYWVPRDGRGLNESLQNPWMVIHPPTLFIGYASMVIPAAFAMGAIVRRDWDSWAVKMGSWLSWGWMVLGTGIFLGAYWAYETLGWGGYWSWDPVENASFLPWLVGTALIHGVVSQQARGNFRHANLFLGYLLFLSVLYASFLVRAGVLGDKSVHAFASPAHIIKVILLVVLTVWAVGGLAFWIARFRDMHSEAAYETMAERPFGFFMGMLVLGASTALIALCVSAPMFTQVTVQYDFYNRAMLPITLVLVLLMAVTPLLPWRKVTDRPLPRLVKFQVALAAAILVAFVPAAAYAYMGGYKDNNGPALFVFSLAFLLSMWTNGQMLAKSLKPGVLRLTSWYNAGPWIAHVAFAFILLGIVITSVFSGQKQVILTPGMTEDAEYSILKREFLRYKYEYLGMTPAQLESSERGGMQVRVTRNGKPTELLVPYFQSEQSQEVKYMGWPRIMSEWWGDVYVAPGGHEFGLVDFDFVTSGQTTPELPAPRSPHRVKLKFDGFDAGEQSDVEKRIEQGKPVEVHAVVTAYVDGQPYENLRPSLLITANQLKPFKPAPIQLPNGETYNVRLMSLAPQVGMAQLSVQTQDVVGINVLYVPGINILWFGCYLLILGSFLTFRRRSQLAARTAPVAVPARTPQPRTGRAPVAEPVGAE